MLKSVVYKIGICSDQLYEKYNIFHRIFMRKRFETLFSGEAQAVGVSAFGIVIASLRSQSQHNNLL